MQIKRDALAGFSNKPAPLPPRVEPVLDLRDELVLLSLDASDRAVRRALGAIKGDRGVAVESLEFLGLLRDGQPTQAAKLGARRERVQAIVRRAATPTGADAELLVLLALAEALPVGKDDRLSARIRLTSIGRGADPPPAVAAVLDTLRTDDLGEALLPADRHLGDANFNPGASGSLGY